MSTKPKIEVYAVVCKDGGIHEDPDFVMISRQKETAEDALCTVSALDEQCGPHRVATLREVDGDLARVARQVLEIIEECGFGGSNGRLERQIEAKLRKVLGAVQTVTR